MEQVSRVHELEMMREKYYRMNESDEVHEKERVGRLHLEGHVERIETGGGLDGRKWRGQSDY